MIIHYYKLSPWIKIQHFLFCNPWLIVLIIAITLLLTICSYRKANKNKFTLKNSIKIFCLIITIGIEIILSVNIANQGNIFNDLYSTYAYPSDILYKDSQVIDEDKGNKKDHKQTWRVIAYYKHIKQKINYGNIDNALEVGQGKPDFELAKVDYNIENSKIIYKPLTKSGQAYLNITNYLTKNRNSYINIVYMKVTSKYTAAKINKATKMQKVICYAKSPNKIEVKPNGY